MRKRGFFKSVIQKYSATESPILDQMASRNNGLLVTTYIETEAWL
jgi:hypothetical protein